MKGKINITREPVKPCQIQIRSDECRGSLLEEVVKGSGIPHHIEEHRPTSWNSYYPDTTNGTAIGLPPH